MKNYIVDDMETLADDIIFELTSQSTEFKNISVIGHYEDIEPIIKELARYDDVYFISLEIGLSGVVEYDDEYILSINKISITSNNESYFVSFLMISITLGSLGWVYAYCLQLDSANPLDNR